MKLWEGEHKDKATGEHVAYLDIAGIPTACYGQTGKHIRAGQRYTDQQCNEMLARELRAKWDEVSLCLRQPPGYLPQHGAAFLIRAYNIGSQAECASAATRYAQRGDWRNACRALQTNDYGRPAWSFIKTGKRLSDGSPELRYVQGLANRRADERRICEGRLTDAERRTLVRLGVSL